ncbi:alpha/beta hydrolase family protein [Kribbella sp. NPDC051587]|uniref:alpha/beta hydrolase family protein n=1 Tax=Kribbella sp. NPDC051587 TaxID=3364119 RepID=UPI0037928BF2
MNRRVLLAAAASLPLAGCSAKPAAASGALQLSYGDDESQVAELHLPPGTAKVPAAVVIHGGFWQSAYGMSLATPLAADLAEHGIAGYAIEYRRVGNGGGWPTTFEDIAAAIDALADQPRIDLTKVIAIGHSAGGQLALWAAARSGRVHLCGAVSQAGVLDLAAAYRQQVGGSAVQDFLGGTPEAHPDRYADASPIQRLPLKVPVALIHGNRDAVVPLPQSTGYLDAAKRAGDDVTLTTVPGAGHFEVIDPAHAAWTATRSEADRLLR